MTSHSALSALGLAALTYTQERGLPVFPICGKRPYVANGFHAASCHPEQVTEWWQRWPDANIGFSPGTMGWLVIDLDGAKANACALDLGLLATQAAEVVTSRGRHLYFALPPHLSIGNGSPWEDRGIDIRSGAGYVLLPPSIHATGHVYRWSGSGSLDDMAPIPPHVLTLLLEHQRASARDNGDTAQPGDMGIAPHTTMRSYVANAKRRGLSDDEITARIDRRIRAYLERVGHSGEGARNERAYRVARWLTNDFAASETLTWSYLLEWNMGNTPPLPRRELAAVLKSAIRNGRRAKGCAHDGGTAA